MTTTCEKIIKNFDEKQSEINYKFVIKQVKELWVETNENNNSDLDFDYFLREKLEEYWNDDNNRAYDFIKEIKGLSYDMVLTIEFMYDEYELDAPLNPHFMEGVEFDKKSLEDKLDLVYYLQAKEFFIDWLEKEELTTWNF